LSPQLATRLQFQLVAFRISGSFASAGCDKIQIKIQPKQKPMPKFIIERELPGAGKMSADELHGISQKSCSVLNQLGPQIQWLESHVTNDKIYCIYIAPNEEMIREHARRGGFPANRISEIKSVIDPTTAE